MLETSKILKSIANPKPTHLETGIAKKWKRFTQNSQITSTKKGETLPSILLISIYVLEREQVELEEGSVERGC